MQNDMSCHVLRRAHSQPRMLPEAPVFVLPRGPEEAAQAKAEAAASALLAGVPPPVASGIATAATVFRSCPFRATSERRRQPTLRALAEATAASAAAVERPPARSF